MFAFSVALGYNPRMDKPICYTALGIFIAVLVIIAMIDPVVVEAAFGVVR